MVFKTVFLLIIFLSISESTADKIWNTYGFLYKEVSHKYTYTVNGRQYRLSPYLLAAITHQESAGNSNALSHAGARGVMQVIPRTSKLIQAAVTAYKKEAQKNGIKTDTSRLQCDYSHMNNPEYNIHCCSFYLAALLQETENDIIKSLSWYNAGRVATERGIMNGRIADNPETRKYVPSILKLYEYYQQRYKE